MSSFPFGIHKWYGLPMYFTFIFLIGTPPVGVFWFHNNVEITRDNPNFLMASLGHVHTLSLLCTTGKYSGEYVCEAYNDYGDTDTFCFVEVRGTFAD